MTFQPGQSGNLNGRPKGIVDKRAKLRSLLEVHADEIIEKLATLAKIGDPTALRLCIERLLPRINPDVGIHLDLPEGRLDKGDNMLQIALGITQAVASGQMTMEDAFKFNNFINNQRRHIRDAEREIEDELEREERRKHWEERLKETDSESD